MKRFFVVVACAAAFLFSGCMGQYALTKKIYNWNEKATGNKFINNGIFWLLAIPPVYDFCLFVDTFVLNVIEFWMGSNPLAFTGSEQLEKVVMGNNGTQYKVTMGNSKITIAQLTGKNAGKHMTLAYVAQTGSYVLENTRGTKAEVGVLNGSNLDVYMPDGRVVTHSLANTGTQLAFSR